jgi:hypothetical protein
VTTDGIQLAPCPACLAHGWLLDEATFTWFRCVVCNPEPPPKASAIVLEYKRGAKVKAKPTVAKPTVDDLPPAA